MLAILPIILAILWIYFSFKLTFWKRQNLGNVWSKFYVRILGQSFVINPDHIKDYGNIYGTYDFLTPVLVITKPQLINDVFNKDSDCFTMRKSCVKSEKLLKNCILFSKTNEYKTHRNIIEKTFSINKNLLELSKHFVKFDSELIYMLNQILAIEPIIDVYAFLNMFSLKKYLSSGFGSAIDPKIQLKLFEYFQLYFQNEKKIKNKWLDFRPVEWTLILEIVEQIYDNRRVDDCKNSLLFMLSDANDSKVMSKKQIMENSLMFVTMGYKSSVVTISHLIFYLATNQKIQQKLIKEIDKYVENQRSNRKSTEFKCSVKSGKNVENKENVEIVDKEVVVEEVDEEILEKQREDYLKAINELEYLDACIKETLRLNPPVRQLIRTANKNKTLDNIFIPKNCRIIVPIVDIHRDPDNYSDPNKFNPERFLLTNISLIRAGTYMPFGDGLRNCLGITPALLEIKLCLINFLSNFRFVKCSQTKELEFNRNEDLFSKITPNSVLVKIIKRNKDVLE